MPRLFEEVITGDEINGINCGARAGRCSNASPAAEMIYHAKLGRPFATLGCIPLAARGRHLRNGCGGRYHLLAENLHR